MKMDAMQAIPVSPYICNPEVVLREEDADGGLLFNPDTNQVKVVNTTGLFIWKLCDGKHSVEAITAALQEAFEEAPGEAVQQDVEEFIKGMLETGFIGQVER